MIKIKLGVQVHYTLAKRDPEVFIDFKGEITSYDKNSLIDWSMKKPLGTLELTEEEAIAYVRMIR